MTSVVAPNNDNYPYSAVVYVVSTFAHGSVTSGSGVMVGPNDVLTASHMLYDDTRGVGRVRQRISRLQRNVWRQ